MPDMDGKKKLEELVGHLEANADAHFQGLPMGRRVTGQLLSVAADTIRSISDAFKTMEEEQDALRFVVGEYAHAADVGEPVNSGISNIASALLGGNDRLKREAVQAALSEAEEGRG